MLNELNLERQNLKIAKIFTKNYTFLLRNLKLLRIEKRYSETLYVLILQTESNLHFVEFIST